MLFKLTKQKIYYFEEPFFCCPGVVKRWWLGKLQLAKKIIYRDGNKIRACCFIHDAALMER